MYVGICITTLLHGIQLELIAITVRSLISDREAGEIIHLVASVHLSVQLSDRPSVWVYGWALITGASPSSLSVSVIFCCFDRLRVCG